MQFPGLSGHRSMSNILHFMRRPLGACLLPALLTGCFEKDSPKGTEVENEVGVGRLFLADGRPAPFAVVRIYNVEALPQPDGQPKTSRESKEADAVLITSTDAQGRFSTGSLPNDEYNILSKLNDVYAYNDSLPLGQGAGPVPPDTLRDPGVVRGYVSVQPQDNPRSVTVQLLGTNRFTNVEEDGRFEFANLAGGDYTVRLVTTLPDYTPTIKSFRAVSGKEVELKDTLRLIYTGISAVTGLAVSYDTAKGIATLRWNRIRHSQLLDYQIYRDEGPRSPITFKFLDFSQDTVFADTIWSAGPEAPIRFPNLLEFGDTSERIFTWRVRARLRTEAVGPLLNSVSAQLISPIWIRTVASVGLVGAIPGNLMTVEDSLSMVVSFNNPLRRIKSIRWYDADDALVPEREISVDTGNGSDTLKFRAGSKPKRKSYTVTLVDETGAVTTAGISFDIVNDAPETMLSASAATLNIGDTVRLQGSARDLGRIVKWEWSIGSTDKFTAAGGPDTSFAVEFLPSKGVPLAYLRATDEDGNATMASVLVNIVPWRNLKRMPRLRIGFTTTALNGQIYVIGGHGNSVDAYDPLTDSWTGKAPMKHIRQGQGALVYGNEIMVAGGRDDDDKTLSTTEFYDPAADSWRTGPDMIESRMYFGLMQQGARVVAFGGEYRYFTNLLLRDFYEAYDSSTKQWSTIAMNEPGKVPRGSLSIRAHMSTAVVGGKTYGLGGITYGIDPTFRPPLHRIEIYDFANGIVSEGNSLDYGPYDRASAAYGDRLLMAGGEVRTGVGISNDRFDVVDPVGGFSRTLSQIRPARSRASLVVLDGKVYLFGGVNIESDGSISDLVQVFALPLDSVLANP
jgi:hypothetical protein